jgi:hypothetical protein
LIRTLFDKNVRNIFERPQDGPAGAKYRDVFRNPSPQLAEIVNKAPKKGLFFMAEREGVEKPRGSTNLSGTKLIAALILKIILLSSQYRKNL